MTAGARGAEVVFHAAAKVADFGPWEAFRRVNVDGTLAALRAARQAGARRFVHVGTEAALVDGQPLVHADERTPLALRSRAHYARSKALAEAAVLGAGGDRLETIVVRPRFVWGVGDTTLLPALVELARSGRWRWIGGGRHLTSTTHVDNAVHALRLAAERGPSATTYFATDGEPVVFREFVSDLLRTQGLTPPEGSVPRPVADAAAALLEAAWTALPLPGAPPLTRVGCWLASRECTLDDARARAVLGYAPVVSREDGLRQLASAS
jgi:nucleoside-diphosphate-sugar epimerase